MLKPIKKAEYESLVIGQDGFEQDHYNALARYNDEHDHRFFKVGGKRITFQQYVGVLKVGDLTVEIYPKLSKGGTYENKWKTLLHEMLRVCHEININVSSDAHLEENELQLTDLFFYAYLKELEPLIHRGLTKKYRQIEENQYALKGKLMFTGHVQKNLIHKERFFVRHQIYSHQHLLNQALLLALELVKKQSLSHDIKRMATSLMLLVPEIEVPHLTSQQLKTIQLNRKTRSHAKAFALAKLIIESLSPDICVGREPLLAILFDMNKLWEEYLFISLKKVLQDKEIRRGSKQFFFSNNGGIFHKPDILVYDKKSSEIPEYIIDAKWKAVDNINDVSSGDLRQVYAYLHQWKSIKGILAYPSVNQKEHIKGNYLSEDGEKMCSIVWATLFNDKLEVNKKFVQNLLPPPSHPQPTLAIKTHSQIQG